MSKIEEILQDYAKGIGGQSCSYRTEKAKAQILLAIAAEVEGMQLLTMVGMSRAITERRSILEMNGHKPTTQDARYAVAEAQRQSIADQLRAKGEG